jgi:integrase
MMNKKLFTGAFSKEMQMFLDEKRSLGLKYVEEERLLHKIDEMTRLYDCGEGLPRELVEEFVRFRPHWAKGTQQACANIIRQFALYLIKLDIPAYCADSCWKTVQNRDFHPYIFNSDEINKIFLVADNPKNSYNKRSRDFHSVIYRLLYSCGLRVSEALHLLMEDVDFKRGTIFIRNPKNHKDRKLPINTGMQSYLENYADIYRQGSFPTEYFFLSPSGTAYSIYSIYGYFRKILAECGIPHQGRSKGGPRLHDVRHTFCVHSLQKMMAAGMTYEASMPILCAYMGHSSLSATAKYLHLTKDLFPDIVAKMEVETGHVIPVVEGQHEKN